MRLELLTGPWRRRLQTAETATGATVAWNDAVAAQPNPLAALTLKNTREPAWQTAARLASRTRLLAPAPPELPPPGPAQLPALVHTGLMPITTSLPELPDLQLIRERAAERWPRGGARRAHHRPSLQEGVAMFRKALEEPLPLIHTAAAVSHMAHRRPGESMRLGSPRKQQPGMPREIPRRDTKGNPAKLMSVLRRAVRLSPDS